MNRRGFLASLFGAPLAVAAALVIEEPKPETLDLVLTDGSRFTLPPNSSVRLVCIGAGGGGGSATSGCASAGGGGNGGGIVSSLRMPTNFEPA